MTTTTGVTAKVSVEVIEEVSSLTTPPVYESTWWESIISFITSLI